VGTTSARVRLVNWPQETRIDLKRIGNRRLLPRGRAPAVHGEGDVAAGASRLAGNVCLPQRARLIRSKIVTGRGGLVCSLLIISLGDISARPRHSSPGRGKPPPPGATTSLVVVREGPESDPARLVGGHRALRGLTGHVRAGSDHRGPAPDDRRA
jgi:hypothetical protein